jgi:hypothetical protein
MIREIKQESKPAKSTTESQEEDNAEGEKYIGGTKVEVPLFGVSEKITLDPDILMYWSYTNKRLEEKGFDQMSLSDFINKAIREYFKKKGIKLAFVHDVGE